MREKLKLESKEDIKKLSHTEINERWDEIKQILPMLPDKPKQPINSNPYYGNGYYVIDSADKNKLNRNEEK